MNEPLYRMLRKGEICRAGDEWLLFKRDPKDPDEWERVEAHSVLVGMVVTERGEGTVRRKVAG